MKVTLEQGMFLYRADGRFRLNINRTTAKRAFAVVGDRYFELVFDREQNNSGYIRPRGSDVWSRNVFSIETPEIKSKYYRMMMENRAEGQFNVKALSDGQLAEIVAIIERNSEEKE